MRQPLSIEPGSRLLLGLMLTILLVGAGMVSLLPLTARANTCQNVIANGDMESSTGWIAQTQGSYSLFSDYQAHSGTQSAYLAGVNNAQDSLRRTVALPAASQLTLNFWWLVNSEESSGGWDGLTVVLADASGNPLRALFTVSDRDAGLVWQQASVDVSQYAGQSVQLQFNARTDSTLATDFFVDDVALTTCAAPAAPKSIFLPWLRR